MASATATDWTPDDLLKITDRPPPDLVDGRLMERPEMGHEAATIAGAILELLRVYARTTLPGMVTGSEGGFQIFPDASKQVRFPDVAFTRRDRVPGGSPPRGHARIAPDLVVEVVSPNDLAEDVEEKIEDYLGAGVPLIWVVYPKTRTIQVHRPDQSASRLRLGETLDGEAVLPGFRGDLARIFEEVG